MKIEEIDFEQHTVIFQYVAYFKKNTVFQLQTDISKKIGTLLTQKLGQQFLHCSKICNARHQKCIQL
jgi:hypothetical protein